MKKILPLIVLNFFVLVSQGQVLLNEVYPEPANGKSEFFELYNTSVSGSPQPMDHYTMVSFFESPGEKGFCVMDLPNLFVRPKGFFVGSAALPFNYQGVSNSTASDFSWNSASFTSNGGYIKKWKYQSNNLTDGNLYYDEVTLPANFNDFFEKRTGTGSTFTIFLYKDGILVNAVCLGTGGATEVLPSIVTMPPLFIDMSGSAPDFTINFSTYAAIPVETVSQDAGTDNGYIRERDGLCGGWTKSSSQVQHTPQLSNGNVDATLGSVSATAVIVNGTPYSSFIYNVVAAPVTSFPIELQAYKDNGPTMLSLDSADEYVESNFETAVSDGPFTTLFSPNNMNMLLVVKTNAGCIDKVIYSVNGGILPLRLIYFKGNFSGQTANLEWKIGNNESAKTFEVQSGIDGTSFTTITSLSTSGKNGEEHYSYSAPANATKIYYRLKTITIDGRINYSNIISTGVMTNSKNSFSVLQNPATDRLKLQVTASGRQTVVVTVYDVSGRIRISEKVGVEQGINFINLVSAGKLNRGNYIVEVNYGNEKFAEKFIRQ